MAMLEVKDLEVYYGMIQAIKGISFEVNQGEVVALIGANGAGKTTTLHTITGLLPSKKGTVTFEGQDITKVPAHKIVYMGVAHVPEGRRVFADLSVYQNLKMGAYTRKDKEEIEQTLAMVYERFPRLKERKDQRAGTLSGGEQQRVQLARCLAQLWRDGAPQGWLFLDEPTSALDLYYQQYLLRLLKRLTAGGQLHVCVVLHDLNLAALWADRILLLHQGNLVAQGTPQEVIQQPVIHRWYGADVRLVQHPDNAAPQVYLAP